MNLEQIKQCIETQQPIDFPIVFVTKDKFIPLQYIRFIDNVQFTTDKNFVTSGHSDIFGGIDATHYVFECDELDFQPNDTAIIICKKLHKSMKGVIETADVPSLDLWMLQDYVYSICEGVSKENLDWLISICKNDVYRISQEIDKICLFDVQDREGMLLQFIQDNVFSDLSDKNIFTMSNAIQARDLNGIRSVYKDLETAPFVVDVEPLGLLTILYNNFSKMIKVWLSRSPTEASTGLNSKQIWAINKLPRVYSKEELIDIFKLIASIDSKFKSGIFPLDILVDYLVIKTQVRS